MATIGTYLHATSATDYFTPWSGRRGNSAIMVIEVIAASLSASPQAKLVVTVQTKNSENTDSPSEVDDLSDFPDITGASSTPVTQFQTGFKELYRYKLSFVQPGANDWVHYRILAPSWVAN